MNRALVVLLAVAALAAGCGSGSSTSTSGSSSGLKVGLVTDIGGLNDKAFNHLAYVGLQRAQQELGVTVTGQPVEVGRRLRPEPVVLRASRSYDLVIAVGFLMADAIDTVAKKFPNTKFAIIDVDAART